MFGYHLVCMQPVLIHHETGMWKGKNEVLYLLIS